MLDRLWTALTGAKSGVDAACERRFVRGLQIEAVPTEEYGCAGIFAGVEAALALIEEHEPIWLARMGRDLAAIRILRYPLCRAAFLPDSRVMLLDSYFVSSFPAPAVASSIVHEATHARLTAGAAGVPYGMDPARHERICRRSEIRFGRRLPAASGEAVVARAAAAEAASDAEVAPLAHPREPRQH